jgi:serine/threonine protein kinase
MSLYGPDNPGQPDGVKGLPKVTRIRNAVILPDGTKKEPLGSGTITGLLGVGGMANVYEIWNSQLELSRAVKLLHPNYTEEALHRFQTEIKITAKLSHRNIIEIHAVGHWNGLPYIEMERISGDTLEKLLEDRGALPLEVCTAIAIMVGRALHYAHTQEYVIYGTTYHGVIHRDLKPSNIMVTDDGIVKLMDFGIARPTDASIHTTDGAILGTMQYLSPEQLDGKEPDVRADIYSLGTILYELLTGIKAFPENNVSKLMLNKIKNEFKPLNQFALTIPSRLRRLVHRCMVYDREKRVQNTQEFLTEIGKIHRSITGSSPEQVVRRYLTEHEVFHTAVSTRRQLPVKPVLIAIGMVCVLAGAGWLGIELWSRISRNNLPAPEIAATIPAEVTSSRSDVTIEPVAPEMEKEGNRSEETRTVNFRPGKKPVSVIQKKESSPPLTTTDKILGRYGAASLLDAFYKSVDRQSWKDALEIISELPSSALLEPRGVVYRARVLRALGKAAELRALLAGCAVEDGELYLQRAALSLQRGDLLSTVQLLRKSEKTVAAFKENRELRLERLYLEAQCAARQFDRDRTEETRRHALDRWYEVKSELRTSRDHPWYREAEKAMQQIAER